MAKASVGMNAETVELYEVVRGRLWLYCQGTGFTYLADLRRGDFREESQRILTGDPPEGNALGEPSVILPGPSPVARYVEGEGVWVFRFPRPRVSGLPGACASYLGRDCPLPLEWEQKAPKEGLLKR